MNIGHKELVANNNKLTIHNTSGRLAPADEHERPCPALDQFRPTRSPLKRKNFDPTRAGLYVYGIITIRFYDPHILKDKVHGLHFTVL